METTDKKAVLLKSVVRVVAEVGIENASTRAIGAEAGFHDAYIYRYFQDKDHLLACAYKAENDRLMKLLVQTIEQENQFLDSKSLPDRSMAVLDAAWKYLTSQPEVTKFLVYYYNSPGFQKYAYEGHRKWMDALCERLYPTFHSIAEAEVLLYMVINTVFGVAKQVSDGALPNTQETENAVFRSIYTTIAASYAKTHKEGPK